MGVVSRGGSFHTAMMILRDEENPLWAEYDYLLEILAEYEVVASLGDGMRPGCHEDATREAKTVEYLNLGKLSRRAHEAGVQRMVEGPGHMPLDQIGYNVRMIKELTGMAPLYLLGPLVTDLAAGYDHINGAIGGAIACQNGANFSAWSHQVNISVCLEKTISSKEPGPASLQPMSVTLYRETKHHMTEKRRWEGQGGIWTGPDSFHSHSFQRGQRRFMGGIKTERHVRCAEISVR